MNAMKKKDEQNTIRVSYTHENPGRSSAHPWCGFAINLPCIFEGPRARDQMECHNP